MKKLNNLLLLFFLILSACSCNCRYNEYLPENNPLLIPPELQVEKVDNSVNKLGK